METAQAFIIVTWFLVKCAGVAIFAVGAYTTIQWLRKNVSFFTYTDEEDTESPEWVNKNYG
jgi:hypothetical protein